MQREKYYVVPENSWLLGQRPPAPGERQKPEELVRQWCAFELIRAYGYRLSDLEFERAVRVGSKTYRIDILLLRDGTPFAVIECKERDHRNPAQGLEQAISYAAAREIGCEFAAYTNGTEWRVSRNIHGIWAPVVDLPERTKLTGRGSIDELLASVQMAAPVLYKLDEPISGREASAFCAALQELFHTQNQLTFMFDRDLRIATDNILRVLSVGMDDPHYRVEKLECAAKALEAFRDNRAIGHQILGGFGNVEFRMAFAELGGCVDAMFSDGDSALGSDVFLLKLDVALLTYGRTFATQRGAHPPIPPEFHHTLRDVLSLGFATGFGVRLPTALDLKTQSDMKLYCREAWEGRMADLDNGCAEAPRLTLWTLLRGIFRRRGH